jgi:hypothetical protein
MKPKIRIVYRKITNPHLPVAKYYPRGYRKGKTEVVTSAVIKLDPILKKPQNKEMKKIILKHETDEIKVRAKGVPKKIAHQRAVGKEPKGFTEKYPTNRSLQKELRK